MSTSITPSTRVPPPIGLNEQQGTLATKILAFSKNSTPEKYEASDPRTEQFRDGSTFTHTNSRLAQLTSVEMVKIRTYLSHAQRDSHDITASPGFPSLYQYVEDLANAACDPRDERFLREIAQSLVDLVKG